MPSTARQNRTLWGKILKKNSFLSETTEGLDSKFGWNVYWIVLYQVTVPFCQMEFLAPLDKFLA
jgi:hypothetical protein